MNEQAIKLMSEIRQFREQYVSEVGEGRRVWPRSIRERIEELENLKVPPKLIASQTGVAYDTILQWRYQRNQKFKKSFHKLEVSAASASEPKKEVLKTVTVTVPNLSPPPRDSNPKSTLIKSVTVTVTTPNGYRIESDNPDTLVFLILALREAEKCS